MHQAHLQQAEEKARNKYMNRPGRIEEKMENSMHLQAYYEHLQQVQQEKAQQQRMYRENLDRQKAEMDEQRRANRMTTEEKKLNHSDLQVLF
jgi:hypothetical protein